MTDKKEILKKYRELKSWHAKQLRSAEAAGQGNSPMGEYFRKMVQHIEIKIDIVKHS